MNENRLFSKKSWVLLKAMVGTNFKLRYQQSVLGYLWSVLKPLMLFAIMYLVFIKFLRFGDDVPHFAVALLLGTVIWNFFTEATVCGMRAVVDQGDLLRKINFPKEIVVLAVELSALINFAISFVVVLIFAMFNGVEFTAAVLWAIPLVIELILLSLGITFFLSALFVTMRDLGPIWDVILQAGFYATPIIYPVALVSTNVGSFLAKLALILNPMAQIIQDMRHVLISPVNQTVWELCSNPLFGLFPIAVSVAVFFLGLMFYKSRSKSFAELV